MHRNIFCFLRGAKWLEQICCRNLILKYDGSEVHIGTHLDHRTFIWPTNFFFFFHLRTFLHGRNPADAYFTLQCLTEVHISPVSVFKSTPYLFYAGFPVSTTGSLFLREKLALLPRTGTSRVGEMSLCPMGWMRMLHSSWCSA